MVMCKRYSLALFVLSASVAFLLGTLLASAELSVQADKGSYNLGDEIVASYELSGDQDFSGLLKLSLSCTNYSLDFYTVPTNRVAGERQASNVPPLAISGSMLDRCYVDAVAAAYDRSFSENSSSGVFNVTSSVSVAVLVPKVSYLPSEALELSGSVGKSHTLPADVSITLGNETYLSSIVNNGFAYSIMLPENIRSGRHSLVFLVNDSYGNSGSASAEFEVLAVPNRIVNTLSSENINPGEAFTVSAVIYDQAGEIINSAVAVTVTDSAGNTVLSASNRTGESITLSFPAGQEPGIYTISSSGKGLSSSSQISVDEVERISVELAGEIVTLKNTGNVGYANSVGISLAGETSYIVSEEVYLQPGQSYEVDLANEVSGGQYNVSFPTLANASSFENVVLADKRSLFKKISDAFGITGKNVVVTSSGKGRIPASLAPFVLVAIILGIAFFFIKNNKKGTGSGSAESVNDMDFGSAGSSVKSETATSNDADVEEASVKRILEEKYRQQLARKAEQPKSLRDDPVAQKFVKDMMKEKKFR
ncbi:MAG TPA: hypothetical protein VI934_04590 [Candidatus Nanoarchaeia archaeon]|nr:hypothetical protein [Candidatus Nanoarchaeia archaeon]